MERENSNKHRRKTVALILSALALAAVAAAIVLAYPLDSGLHRHWTAKRPGEGHSGVVGAQAPSGDVTPGRRSASTGAGTRGRSQAPSAQSGSASTAVPIEATAALGVSGRGRGLLMPGGPLVPVNLRFTNPYGSSATVTTATVTIDGVSHRGCDRGDFTVARQLTATATVPARTSAWLSELRVPISGWPQLKMREHGTQNACQGSMVSLRFAATARIG